MVTINIPTNVCTSLPYNPIWLYWIIPLSGLVKKYSAPAYFTHNKQEKVNCTCFPNSLGASTPVSVFAAMGFDTVKHTAYEP